MSKRENKWTSFDEHLFWMKKRKNRRKARFYKKLSRSHPYRYLYSVRVLGIRPNNDPLKVEIAN